MDSVKAYPRELQSPDELRRETDGYIARYDRSLSIALSRRLARTAVTPNQITTAGLLLGLLGSWLLASVRYPTQCAGAVFLWTCCILDGCDGEIARLKRLATPWGGRYDVVADNIVHLAIFVAIGVHLQRVHPETRWGPPSALMISGVLASMLAVWRLILRKPESERGQAARVLERIASRDFIYLVLALTLLGRLEWFLWGAAIGSHLFWICVWRISGREGSA